MSDRTFTEKPPQLFVQAHEVVKEIDDRPHLLVRIDISGPFFPHRAPEPFVRIITSERLTVECWFADVLDNNRKLVGYFPVDLPDDGMIEVGYGDELMATLPAEFRSEAVIRLDRERLPEEVVVVTAEFLKARQ